MDKITTYITNLKEMSEDKLLKKIQSIPVDMRLKRAKIMNDDKTKIRKKSFSFERFKRNKTFLLLYEDYFNLKYIIINIYWGKTADEIFNKNFESINRIKIKINDEPNIFHKTFVLLCVYDWHYMNSVDKWSFKIMSQYIKKGYINIKKSQAYIINQN